MSPFYYVSDNHRMFKTDLPLVTTFNKLLKEEGWAFALRGMTSNTTAVAIPIAITIFACDLCKSIKYSRVPQ